MEEIKSRVSVSKTLLALRQHGTDVVCSGMTKNE